MKNLKRKLRAKRAFSAVIASLIMMLLAVAAGVVVYAYVMGWIGGTTQSSTRTGQLQFDSIYASYGTPGKIKIYVRNVGGMDLNVTNIYVGGVATANNTALTDGTVSVHTVIYLEVNCTMTQNYFYTVAVSCKDGTTVSQSVQAK